MCLYLNIYVYVRVLRIYKLRVGISHMLTYLYIVQVLIATSTLAWGVNLPAHLVIIKGTEYFDGKTKRYVRLVNCVLHTIRFLTLPNVHVNTCYIDTKIWR